MQEEWFFMAHRAFGVGIRWVSSFAAGFWNWYNCECRVYVKLNRSEG